MEATRTEHMTLSARCAPVSNHPQHHLHTLVYLHHLLPTTERDSLTDSHAHRQVNNHNALRSVLSHSESISLSRCTWVPESTPKSARGSVSSLVDQIEQGRPAHSMTDEQDYIL